jgi:hypothetical protein
MWTLILLLATTLPSPAQGQTVDEYQVKAAYVYNFAKFVDWPPEAFDTPAQPIVFCVLGETPLNLALRDALSGKVVDRRPLVFRELQDSKQANKCQVLFISPSDKKHLHQTLDELKSLSVLTVGEAENFTSEGGIVRFVLDAGRVQLEFNLDAADDAKLRVSSKLLSLGKTVRKGRK